MSRSYYIICIFLITAWIPAAPGISTPTGSSRKPGAGRDLNRTITEETGTTPVLPSVSNVRVSQWSFDPRFVDITYDLDHPSLPYASIGAMLSLDGGKTFPHRINSLLGDVNDFVPTGSGRRMIWNAFRDHPGSVMDNAVIRILADLPPGDFTIKNLSRNHAAPFLLDFNFFLREQTGASVVSNPKRFQIKALEDGSPLDGAETGTRLTSGISKQVRCQLIMDYTAGMADIAHGDQDGDGISDAIEEMEGACKRFIEELRADVLIGLYEFHREDQSPNRVSDFTMNKSELEDRIKAIWTDYVQSFPGGSRCWDALHAAIGDFPGNHQYDELRFLVFFSDGNDESSTRTPIDIVQAALSRNVRIYGIGFGNNLDPAPLKAITTQTGGSCYEAGTVSGIGNAMNHIMQDIRGEFNLRWVTLKRSDMPFTPSFRISLQGRELEYTDLPFTPTDYQGELLRGNLRFIGSPVKQGKTTVFLRCGYTPRYIRKIRIYVKSRYPHLVHLTREQEGGLCPLDWQMRIRDEIDGEGEWIEVTSPNPDDINTSLPYGAFGPLLSFDVTGLERLSDLFLGTGEEVRVDNGIYTETGGQSFLLEVDW